VFEMFFIKCTVYHARARNQGEFLDTSLNFLSWLATISVILHA